MTGSIRWDEVPTERETAQYAQMGILGGRGICSTFAWCGRKKATCALLFSHAQASGHCNTRAVKTVTRQGTFFVCWQYMEDAVTYKRVTAEERRLIYRWRREGCGVREIGRRLGRSAFTEAVRLGAERGLLEGWTPEIISGRARLEGRDWVCKETIYKHVYADAKAGGDLWKNLPRAHRKRRRRCPRVDGRGRGRIPNRRMIDTRPAEVETRVGVGHWEGDLINGAAKTGNRVTAVERKTRFTLVGRADTKEAGEVTSVLRAMFFQMPEIVRTGLTLDNGKEFARIGRRGLRRIERHLNDRTRKCLGWRTPREAMAAFLASAP